MPTARYSSSQFVISVKVERTRMAFNRGCCRKSQVLQRIATGSRQRELCTRSKRGSRYFSVHSVNLPQVLQFHLRNEREVGFPARSIFFSPPCLLRPRQRGPLPGPSRQHAAGSNVLKLQKLHCSRTPCTCVHSFQVRRHPMTAQQPNCNHTCAKVACSKRVLVCFELTDVQHLRILVCLDNTTVALGYLSANSCFRCSRRLDDFETNAFCRSFSRTLFLQ